MIIIRRKYHNYVYLEEKQCRGIMVELNGMLNEKEKTENLPWNPQKKREWRANSYDLSLFLPVQRVYEKQILRNKNRIEYDAKWEEIIENHEDQVLTFFSPFLQVQCNLPKADSLSHTHTYRHTSINTRFMHILICIYDLCRL